METQIGRSKIQEALSSCLQAESQGLLKGDLNMAQVAALSLVQAYDRSIKAAESKSKAEVISDIVDLYLKLEHPQAFEEVERYRAAHEEKPDQELVAQDMNDMLGKLLEMAGM